MLEFLTGPKTLEKAQDLLRTSDEAILAVAYWGKGAKTELGLGERHAGKVTVICDPFSGACNPQALADLIFTLGKKNVRAKRHLHAKVFWTPSGVIVGSANVSANGLGFEGNESGNRNIEASIFSCDSGTIREIRTWLNDSVLPGVIVDENVLAKCREAWKKRRRSRFDFVVTESGSKMSLWQAAQQQPDAVADLVYVWIYPWKEMSSSAQSDRMRPQLGCYELHPEQTALSENSYVIDLSHENGKPHYGGVWRVVPDPWRERNGTSVLLVKRVKAVGPFSLAGLKHQALRAAAARLVANPKLEEELALSEFAEVPD